MSRSMNEDSSSGDKVFIDIWRFKKKKNQLPAFLRDYGTKISQCFNFECKGSYILLLYDAVGYEIYVFFTYSEGGGCHGCDHR